MQPLAAVAGEISMVFIELGLVVLALAFLARVANHFGFSAVPLYLLAGLAFGNGGLMPLKFGEDFVRIGAEVGVVLLLFMLGLEYTGEKLVATMRARYRTGIFDLIMNFTPGFLAGLVVGMSALPSVLLGGITWISSSGITAKILHELGDKTKGIYPTVVAILVLEDLAMAAFLPIVSVLLAGNEWTQATGAVSIAIGTVILVLWFAVRYGRTVSRFAHKQSDEIVMLATLGIVLLCAGVAQQLQVSAAVGAFLVGVAVSGHLANRAAKLLSPLRDLFAATFFLFFGLQIDPTTLPPAIPLGLALAVVTGATKLATGYISARRRRLDKNTSLRAGAVLICRGEFSIVIAGLGAGIEPRLGPLAAAYVLLLAIIGPVVLKLALRESATNAS
jgi:CPA2 family monovalent cation:H+ antiporter-2